MFELTAPLGLVLLLALAVYSVLVWRSGLDGLSAARHRLSLGLRLGMLAAVCLALAGLGVRQPVGQQAVVFVGDLSASASGSRAEQEGWIRRALAAKSADDAFAVVATAQEPLVDWALGTAPVFAGFQSLVRPEGTDLAGGLRLAGALLPSTYRGRVVLLSDGQETSGDARQQARLLRAAGIVVDAVPLAVVNGPEALLERVVAPASVSEGERFAVRVEASASAASQATVRLYQDGTLLGEQRIDLKAGSPSEVAFTVTASGGSGLHRLRATLDATPDTLTQNNEALAVVNVQGPPSVLIVAGRAGEAANLERALIAGGMHVEMRPPEGMPTSLDELGAYQAIVLADVAADALGDARMQLVRSFVRDLGRGLLTIGGDTSYGDGGYSGTSLEDALPVTSDVRARREQGRVALALVIDRSGSMGADPAREGTSKMAMAREAAAEAVEQLGPRDQVGVLAFDSQPSWIVGMDSVEANGGAAGIRDRIGRLDPGGGTDIYPALAAGYDAVRQTAAQYRHVILLTDGMSCCGGEYATLLDSMRAGGVTLSTIGVGQDADLDLLEQLARVGNGRFYFTQTSRDIPRLMTRETRLLSRSAVVEGDIAPRLVMPDPLVASVAADGVPPLGGYLVTTPRDLAEVVLASDSADPILARWQYGLGRAVAWTSDFRGRWTSGWVDWPPAAQFFAGLVGWSMPPPEGPLDVQTSAAAAVGRVSVDDAQPGGTTSAPAVRARVVGPDGTISDIGLSATAPGRYTAEFPATSPGAYLVHVERDQAGQTQSAEAGLSVPYSAEYRRLTVDSAHLEAIARAGGGRLLTDPAEAFAADLPPRASLVPLRLPLLLLAALLLPVDVAARRLRLGPLEAKARLERLRSVESVSPAWISELKQRRSERPPRRATPPVESGLAPPTSAEAALPAPPPPTGEPHTGRLVESRRRRRKPEARA